jgi:membrane protein implicated in regulation of membrane protease activity
MAESTVWWLLAGAAVAVELVTGTFYLLMAAIGLAAGALAAHAGLGITWQLVGAAVVGSAALGGLHLLRGRRPQEPPARSNRDVNLDIGEAVQVADWLPDGTSTVRYRGATWAVEAAPGVPRLPGTYRVREVVGNRLVVEPA